MMAFRSHTNPGALAAGVGPNPTEPSPIMLRLQNLPAQTIAAFPAPPISLLAGASRPRLEGSSADHEVSSGMSLREA